MRQPQGSASCGNHRCKRYTPPTTPVEWVVDDDYCVMRATAYEAKHGYVTVANLRVPDASIGRIRRLMCPHFSTREKAEAHALVELRTAIESSEARAVELKAILANITKKSPT